ncbi:MAG: glycosyltransferase [Bacteroidales bacterium]
MKKSIIFLTPDYHCSFFYRDELRKLGWKADIFVPAWYPLKLLYSKKDIITNHRELSNKNNLIYHIKNFYKYKYFFFYGGLEQYSVIMYIFHRIFYHHYLSRIFNYPKFRIELSLAKLLRIKIIYLPTGVPDEDMPHILEKLGNEETGLKFEDSKKMKRIFKVIRRYSDLNIGQGTFNSSQFKARHIKYKSIDLNLWHPNIKIPDDYKLPQTKNLRILHSSMFSDERIKKHGGDIKGSFFVQKAVEKLKDEGYNIEFLFIKDVSSNQMRFLQVQADIVVEQLIRGWWGSTGVETMALGKPVVCYLRPEWKEFFFKTFPEYDELPIVEANKVNIYDVLKNLVEDEQFRINAGRKSREFAERHFNPETNAKELEGILLKL